MDVRATGNGATREKQLSAGRGRERLNIPGREPATILRARRVKTWKRVTFKSITGLGPRRHRLYSHARRLEFHSIRSISFFSRSSSSLAVPRCLASRSETHGRRRGSASVTCNFNRSTSTSFPLRRRGANDLCADRDFQGKFVGCRESGEKSLSSLFPFFKTREDTFPFREIEIFVGREQRDGGLKNSDYLTLNLRWQLVRGP